MAGIPSTEIIQYGGNLLSLFVDGLGVRNGSNAHYSITNVTISNPAGSGAPMLWDALWAVSGKPGQYAPAIALRDNATQVIGQGDIYYSFQGRWKIVSEDSYRPPARKGHVMTTVGDRIFLFGGERAVNATVPMQVRRGGTCERATYTIGAGTT